MTDGRVIRPAEVLTASRYMTMKRDEAVVNIYVDSWPRRRENGPESDDARHEGWKWELHERGPDE
jgi:hypothetical protein